MSTLLFNANEVFEVAKRIERNGAAYYRAAESALSDQRVKNLMHALADMEVTHEQIFAKMQSSLGGNELEEPLNDPHKDAFNFLSRMADRYVFPKNAGPNEILSNGTDLASVLTGAIEREKDSIIFYEGAKMMVPEKYGHDRLNEIIDQEMGHIIILSREIEKIKR